MSEAAAPVDDGSHGHGGHGHGAEAVYPYTPHHFHAAKQHFESGKMGVWLFLVTEILFFAGLFCAYTIYRAQHPEVFYWAHFFLDTTWGAVNTVVLILSSFTAAWAVRNAQLGQMKLLRMNILLTIVGALIFMCVKYVEYSHKFHDGLLPMRHFDPQHEVWEVESFKKKHPEAAQAAARIVAGLQARKGETADAGKQEPAIAAAAQQATASELADDVWLSAQLRDLTPEERRPLQLAGLIRESADGPVEFARPEKAGVFFSIYFFMTGLHGLHVVIGIGLWVWMLAIASRRRMGQRYFGPIDFTALYWHLVDLIWIYLFPMLYLIH